MVAITTKGDSPDLEKSSSNIENVSTTKYFFKVIESFINSLTYILLGCIVFVNMWFVFYETAFTPFRQHVFFCVLGYQLLMALSILSLAPGNGWSSSMSLSHQRRAHWVIQIVASGMAIAGSAIEIMNRNRHFSTNHGTFGIIAMIFLVLSLINGVTSLYATELRRVIPPNLSKLSHILFGTATFAFAGASLCYGYDHRSFKTWSSDGVVYLMISLTSIYTIIVLLTPCWRFNRKMYNIVKNR